MEGFKANPKMKSEIACFKEGGSTNLPFKKKEKAESHEDVAMDKKVVKKAVAQHEGAKHKGETKTELKLKKGGRCKKDGGTVGRYKAGGAVAMKKDKEDKKKIANVKRMQTPKAAAPSAASSMPSAAGLQNLAGGKRVKPKFFNEEPDDMTAPPPKGAKKLPMPANPKLKNITPAPMQGTGASKGYERGTNPMEGLGSVSNYERAKIEKMFEGGPGDVMVGLGNISDYERGQLNKNDDILRGIEAVGKYMGGGKVGC